ncbi:MAG: hypothetical protein R6U96_17380 [Promethearchaeia archaeon]
MKKNKERNIAYCQICEEFVYPVRKPVKNQYNTLFFLVGLMTAGLGVIIYAIYRFIFMKKKYCPYCEAELKDFI